MLQLVAGCQLMLARLDARNNGAPARRACYARMRLIRILYVSLGISMEAYDPAVIAHLRFASLATPPRRVPRRATVSISGKKLT